MHYHHISLKLDLCQFFFPFWTIFWLKLTQWLQIIERDVFDVWRLKFNSDCTPTLCWMNLNPHWHTSKHLMHFFHQSVITSGLTADVTAKTLTSLPAIQSVCSSHSIPFVCLFVNRERWVLPCSPLCVAEFTHSSPGPMLPRSTTDSLRTQAYNSAAEQGSRVTEDKKTNYTHTCKHTPSTSPLLAVCPAFILPVIW